MARHLHVVTLPYLAFGHMIPFLELSIALAKAGVHVSFISTPRNVSRLPKLPPNLTAVINFVELPLPKLENEALLPEGAEASLDVSFEQTQHLKVAYDLMQLPVKQLVANLSPDWIIADGLTHWAVDIAREMHVPLMLFSVFSAATNVFFGAPEYLIGEGKRERSKLESLMTKPPWVYFSSSVAFQRYEAVGVLKGFYGKDASGLSNIERIGKTLDGCQAIAIRSCTEVEGEYLDLFEKLLRKPVIPVGLLPPKKPERIETLANGSWVKIFKWLDEQKPRSVVFVGFGSECKLTKEQVHEIAHGLELSELPFLWALRKPSWAIDYLDALPLGFNDRMNGKGMVCIGWAPQFEILSHRSIGGSLFHSGWGSVIETLQFGHCLIVLPLIIDQGLNAKLLVDKGLAMEIKRCENGSFSRDDIANSLKHVMVSKEGEHMRIKAREATKIFGNQKFHQDNYIGGLVEYLTENSTENSAAKKFPQGRSS